MPRKRDTAEAAAEEPATESSREKENIEKLGKNLRQGCFSHHKPECCHLLGDYLEGIKKDFEKAAKVFRSTCDDYDYGKSCYKFGNYCFLGKNKSGSKGEPLLAYQYYEKGCNLEDSDACLLAGLLLMSNTLPKEMKRDVTRGVAFLTKSCNLDNAKACFYLSGMYIDGTPNSRKPNGEAVVTQDHKKAFQYAGKACELGSMHACANLSQMYARGDGTERDQEQAEKYLQRALDIREEIRSKRREKLKRQEYRKRHAPNLNV